MGLYRGYVGVIMEERKNLISSSFQASFEIFPGE